MTTRRLAGTAAVMGAAAALLAWLTPGMSEMTEAVLAAQHTADTAGAEALLLAAVGLLAWGVWAWGATGLLLTAASALPGGLGATADVLTRVVLPGGARRAAALALGVGLGVAAPLAGAALVVPAPAAAADAAASSVPDWPASGDTGAGSFPDWPAASDAEADHPAELVLPGGQVTGEHVVLRGDCLWDIAAAHLAGRLGRPPTDGEIAASVDAWWSANKAVIGADPDVLLPGQVLRPPP